MHTTPTNTAPNPELLTRLREAEAEAEIVMRRVETKALETLEELMDEPEPTSDAKQDAIVARERNRRRLAATQALTHIRAVQREQRTVAKARANAMKQKEQSEKVPPATCPPVPAHDNRMTEPDTTPPPSANLGPSAVVKPDEVGRRPRQQQNDR